MIWTKAFWKGLGERAIKTFAQSSVASAAVSVVGNTTGVTDINWVDVLSIATLATILSALTSIGNANFTSGVPEVVISTGKHSAVVVTETVTGPGVAADPNEVVVDGPSQ